MGRGQAQAGHQLGRDTRRPGGTEQEAESAGEGKHANEASAEGAEWERTGGAEEDGRGTDAPG
eukprot:3931571-Rhodomonas_salina.1